MKTLLHKLKKLGIDNSATFQVQPQLRLLSNTHKYIKNIIKSVKSWERRNILNRYVQEFYLSKWNLMSKVLFVALIPTVRYMKMCPLYGIVRKVITHYHVRDSASYTTKITNSLCKLRWAYSMNINVSSVCRQTKIPQEWHDLELNNKTDGCKYWTIPIEVNRNLKIVFCNLQHLKMYTLLYISIYINSVKRKKLFV